LDLFQKSQTIEDFEKTLNSEEAGVQQPGFGILDKKWISSSVSLEKDKDDFTFIHPGGCQQDREAGCGRHFVSKDENKKITMQAVGEGYIWKRFVVELNESVTAAVTANPAYKW
jgi:hypothetical protein